MSGPAVSEDVADTAQERLQRLLQGLDQYQLEGLVLSLQCPELVQPQPAALRWALLRGSGAAELASLLPELWPGRAWEEVLGRVFCHLGLPFPQEEVREAMSEPVESQDGIPEHPEMPEDKAHWRRYREALKEHILRLWARTPWPEGHIHLRHLTEQEHRELERVLSPCGPGTQSLAVVLEGAAGVGKSTVAAKLALHWAEGRLFQRRFCFVAYLSCHRVSEMGDASLADLLALHWPRDAPLPLRELQGHPERLLLILDGFEELPPPRGEAPGPRGAAWHRRLPAPQVLAGLLRRELLPAATLLVTCRAASRGALRRLLPRPTVRTLRGFSEADREEYFLRFFRDRARAADAVRWLRASGQWLAACAAPQLCWAVGSGLEALRAANPSVQLRAQTPTGLYAGLFSGLLASAGGREAWGALCRLAAWAMWHSAGTFPTQVPDGGALPEPFVQALLRRGVLRPVASCEEGCVAFAHPSFQAFLAALFYVLRGTRGCLGRLPKQQELHALLGVALADRAAYWEHTVVFFFGLLRPDVARPLEEALPGALGRAAAEDQLLEWAEGLETPLPAPAGHALLFQCLREAREAAVVRGVLGHLREADVRVCGSLQLRDAAFCLRECRSLRKLRLSVSGLLPIVDTDSGGKTPGAKATSSKMRQWQDICSVFGFGAVQELDLSNSTLSTLAMKRLCRELRSPRCKLQRLTCRCVGPPQVLRELAMVLHGNSRLTHLDLSSNDLGLTVSTVIFKTLQHPACQLRVLRLESCHLPAQACRRLFQALGQNSSLTFLSLGDNDLASLKDIALPVPTEATPHPQQHPLREVCLEKCNLTADTYQGLASFLVSTRWTTHLCLGFNPLQDEGAQLLCTTLAHPECALERLELWFCHLGAPSCQSLSAALLQNSVLTHLNLRRNCLGDEGVAGLCPALRGPHCRLQRLDLSACSFSAPGCRELAAALQDNHSLQSLDVGENEIGDAGVGALSKALAGSACALTTLGLQKCQLTTAGCEHLSRLLRRSKSLASLNMLGNDLQPQGVSMLWRALKSAQCPLRKLGLDRDLLQVAKELVVMWSPDSALKIQCWWDSGDSETRWWW